LENQNKTRTSELKIKMVLNNLKIENLNKVDENTVLLKVPPCA
jgi:hypothetical protein